jgi:DNA-binding response OmpR family regulator
MSKVLIIEDEKDLLDIYKMQLELEGFEVVTSSTLEDGFDLIKKEMPNVILLDLLLSHKDVEKKENLSKGGCILLKKVKSDKKTKDIKVVICSNLDTQQDRDETMRLGACYYLVKSEVVPRDVVALVKKLIKESK